MTFENVLCTKHGYKRHITITEIFIINFLSRKIDKIKLGHGNKADMAEIQEWSHIIKQSSRCGLGKTSTNCLLTAMLKFPEEFEKLTQNESNFNGSFNINKATHNYDTIIQEIESTYD